MLMLFECDRVLNMKIHYIVPLRRNITLVPYRMKFASGFMCNGGQIQPPRRSLRLGYEYIFQEPMMRVEEESSILKNLASSENNIEYFEDMKNLLSVFTIIFDANQDPFEICGQYKSREVVEQAFDIMRGDLESDKTYLRYSEMVKVFFFNVFPALRIRFRILSVLKDHSFLGNKSVDEIRFELSKLDRIVEKRGAEYFCSSSKNRVEKIVDMFKNLISTG